MDLPTPLYVPHSLTPEPGKCHTEVYSLYRSYHFLWSIDLESLQTKVRTNHSSRSDQLNNIASLGRGLEFWAGFSILAGWSGAVDFWNSAFLVAFGLAQILASRKSSHLHIWQGLMNSLAFIGWWTDRSSSRRAPFLTGLALIFGASLLLCFATRPWVMIIARALAGFSAGVVFCTGLTLVVDSVPRKEIGEWMGFALSGMTWGTMTGPLLGGIIYKRAGYYAVFLTLLVVIVFDFVLRLTMIETDGASKWRDTKEHISSSSQAEDNGRIKSYGAQGNRVSCSGETVGAEQVRWAKTGGDPSQKNQSTKPQPNDATPLLGFRGTRDPWYQRRFPALTALLSSKRLVAAVLGTFVYNSLIASFDDILPLFAHRTFGWDSETAGLLYLTIPIPSLSGPFIGMLSDRYGARIVALFGFGLTTPCLCATEPCPQEQCGPYSSTCGPPCILR